jgi:hypothetical protein
VGRDVEDAPERPELLQLQEELARGGGPLRAEGRRGQRARDEGRCEDDDGDERADARGTSSHAVLRRAMMIAALSAVYAENARRVFPAFRAACR